MLAFAHNVPLSMCTPAPRASPLSEPLQGKMILAPLTRGGNLPFRRLCVDYGMEVSFGEMVYARNLLKEAQRGRNGPEQARLRRAPNEQFFGVQIATNDIEEGLAAAKIVAESGADFIDLNCGCPIYEATRRNLGSALLRNPERLASLVEGLAGGSSLPVSVKVRLAAMGGEVNINEVAGALYEAGAAALTIHGRTASDRYTKAADWAVIACVVDDCRARGGGMPIVGNGDILSHADARGQMAASGVDAVMVGRGALIKPWLFGEYAQGQALEPTAQERVAIYRKLTAYMKEHFGDDARGRTKAWQFLPWHLDFFRRHGGDRNAESGVEPDELQTVQTRVRADDLPPLERLLCHRAGTVHEQMAALLWDGASDADAVLAFTRLAESGALERAEAEGQAAAARETEELANLPSGKERKERNQHRKREPVKRTEEEIVALRAVRAAKRALTGAPPHDPNAGRRR